LTLIALAVDRTAHGAIVGVLQSTSRLAAAAAIRVGSETARQQRLYGGAATQGWHCRSVADVTTGGVWSSAR
jgi:hypothetical protein